MAGYKEIVRPGVSLVDSEWGHISARRLLQRAQAIPGSLELFNLVLTGGGRFDDPRLHQSLFGKEIRGAVIVGAGWDKNGDAVEGLYQLGFAGVEVGTVTPWPQDGNPQPRQFRVINREGTVTINRLGFNGEGMYAVGRKLRKYRNSQALIGGSVGKNKEVPDKYAPAMHAAAANYLYNLVDYIALNVSSPNTPGLRALQGKELLRDNAQAINQVMDAKGKRKPRLVKIAPDLEFSAVDDVIEVINDEGFDGIIAANTTINPQVKAKYGGSWGGKPDGGLAGDDPDFRKMSTDIIRHIRRADNKIVILGVGGVKDGPTALEKIQAGATRVQVVSGIWSEGPFVARNIDRWLVNYMMREGVGNISELVGQRSR